MPVLEDLPNEVIREILSCLSCVDISNISLVSHFLNTIAEPYLYQSISGESTTETSITPLLRVILARPALGRHVRVLHLTWLSHTIIDPHSSDHALFSVAARRLGLSDRPWCVDAQALLLLHLVPNLQELNPDGSPLLYEFLQNRSTSQLLPSLRRFADDGYTPSERVTVPLLAAVMQFPSIRQISVHMESADDDTNQPSLIPFRGKSPVTHLSFFYGNATNFMLNEILQVPRALTHFTYRDCFDFPHFETTTFRSALRHLRPTLRFLRLGPLRTLRRNQANESTIGSPHDWPALKTVNCGIETLLGRPSEGNGRLVHVLPLGITELIITRGRGRGFRNRSVDEWTDTDMTDQVVEPVENRQLVQLTVNTGMAGRGNGVLVNDQKVEVMGRLKAAYGVAGVGVERIVVE